MQAAIRGSLNTRVGDWIAGWSSYTLNKTKVGEERLVYLAQISEIISIEEYWNRKDFECKKIIDFNNHNLESFYGDNIYGLKTENFINIQIIIMIIVVYCMTLVEKEF